VRQTLLEHPISLVPVNKICRSPHTNDKGESNMRSYKAIMAIIAKIWSQWAPKNDHTQRCLVLDVVPRRPSAHWRSFAHTPSTCQSGPWLCFPTPIKPPQTRNTPLRTCPHCPDPALSSGEHSSLAQATRASATATSHSRRHLASPEPLNSFPVKP
jgi:hypothetical protein